MKELGGHSDNFFIKGFDLWLLFDKIVDMTQLSELYDAPNFTAHEKERIFKILKIFSLAVMTESFLIERMDINFKSLEETKVEIIKDKILKRIEFNQNLENGEVDDLLKKHHISDSNQLINPLALQHLAGYSMGGLIGLARNNFSLDSAIIEKMNAFKDERDYVIHNSTSSTHDIDQKLEQALSVGNEALNLLRGTSVK